MFDLSGRTALVTGASGGIGQAIARALHGRGANVAISGTRKEALGSLAAELRDRVHILPCDLADPKAVEQLVPAAEAAMGSLDILVNNAGLTRDNISLRMRGRRMGSGHCRQSDGRLSPRARRAQGDGAAAGSAGSSESPPSSASSAIRGRAITPHRKPG